MGDAPKTKTDRMREIKDEVTNLTASPLYTFRTEHGYFPVLGEGSHDAAIMFIGEGPGQNEAKTGRPFCGAAGKILDTLLDEAGIAREEVYITNIIKDRPPNNRDPLPSEIEVYAPFLDRQIEIIQPKVIATLGRYAMSYIMKKFDLEAQIEPISKAHGKTYEAQTLFGSLIIMPLFHPAVVVYDNTKLETLRDDFKKLSPYYSSSKKSKKTATLV